MMEKYIETYARQIGANLVGFADVLDFHDAPEGYKPTDIMPGAKSVVVLAKATPVGVVQSNNQVVYTAHIQSLFQSMDTLAYEVALYLEAQGFRAMPVPADDPYFYWDEERKHGMGILSHRHAAAKAGLGILGKNSLLVTPEYGNRVLLVTVLTDASLTTTLVVDSQEKLCPATCRLCINACPAEALTGNRSVIQKLCREHFPGKSDRGHFLYDCWKCRAACPTARK
jgi:epoxyqueuosine reductase